MSIGGDREGREEIFEVVGLGVMFFTVLTYFRMEVTDFFKTNLKGTLLLLVAPGLIAVGDGFLHFQYDINGIKEVGLVIALAGFATFILANKKLTKRDVRLKLIREDHLYLFMFFFFIILPTIFHRPGYAPIVIVWVPAISIFSVYLYRRHPITVRASAEGYHSEDGSFTGFQQAK